MKNNRSNCLVKLIASLCIIVSLLGITPNNKVWAADSGDEEVFGGVLLTPVTRLITAFADGAMDLIHSATLNQDSTIIRLDAKADSWWQNFGRTVFAIIAGIGVAAAVIFVTIGTGGLAGLFAGGVATKLAGAAFLVKTVGTGLIAGAALSGGWIVVGEVIDSTMMEDDIAIPVFNLTPEDIFLNNIWLFDVNFFEPDGNKNFYIAEDNSADLSGKVAGTKSDSVVIEKSGYNFDDAYTYFQSLVEGRRRNTDKW